MQYNFIFIRMKFLSLLSKPITGHHHRSLQIFLNFDYSWVYFSYNYFKWFYSPLVSRLDQQRKCFEYSESAESKLVKLETSHSVILPPTASVLCLNHNQPSATNTIDFFQISLFNNQNTRQAENHFKICIKKMY